MSAATIFISIASYRDPQLTATVADCLAKAYDPSSLRFGICWQRLPGQENFPFLFDPRFRVLRFHWRESRGVCWARSEIMKQWQGEEFYLQIDSHCRFIQNWDLLLKKYFDSADAEKPLITTYGSGFKPGSPDDLEDEQLQIVFHGFDSVGLPQIKPERIARSPVLRRARFLAGGFIFASGTFVDEVPYDPEIYFAGEEISMAARAFTHGYDLFHPCEPILWHYYSRGSEPRHWLDHIHLAGVERTWKSLNRQSIKRVMQLLSGTPLCQYGLGSARTLAEYEVYSGLSFATLKTSEAARLGQEPAF